MLRYYLSGSSSSSISSRGRVISSGTKVTGSRQALCPLPLTFAGQPSCKQCRFTVPFTSQKLYQNSASRQSVTRVSPPSWILDAREIRQTEVRKHNPRPTLRGSKPDRHWPAPRPWAVREAIGVLTQPGGFFFAHASAHSSILPTGRQRALASRALTGIA